MQTPEKRFRDAATALKQATDEFYAARRILIEHLSDQAVTEWRDEHQLSQFVSLEEIDGGKYHLPTYKIRFSLEDGNHADTCVSGDYIIVTLSADGSEHKIYRYTLGQKKFACPTKYARETVNQLLPQIARAYDNTHLLANKKRRIAANPEEMIGGTE